MTDAVGRIRNEAEARALAHRLLSPGMRDRPSVVVSVAPDADEPYADVEAVAKAVGDLVEIFVLPAGDVSWEFAKEMPAQTNVYGGAVRIYPLTHEWVADPERSRVRFAYTVMHRPRLTQLVIEDVLRLVPREHRLGERRKDKWIDPRDERIDELEKELEQLRERNRALEGARQKLAKQLKRAAERQEQDGDRGPWFPDPEEQFRFEVYCEWARRIPAGQKVSLPLAEYFLGPEFLPSLDDLEGVSREKVVAVVVEVLTGLAATSAGREMHVLRESEAANSAAVTRADGGVCWRVALQRATANARRLHVWRVDNWFELARVTVHDDFRP